MAGRAIKYPFIPKSTVDLAPGQFWSFPLLGKRFACGRVLQLRYKSDGKQDSKVFLAGLLNWVDSSPPTYESIANCSLLAHGGAHIKAITENAGEVLGLRPLELDQLEIPLTLSQRAAQGCQLQRGFNLIGPASREQIEALEVFSTWGYGVFNVLAEHHFLRSNSLLNADARQQRARR